jgi:hypothetical protein
MNSRNSGTGRILLIAIAIAVIGMTVGSLKSRISTLEEQNALLQHSIEKRLDAKTSEIDARPFEESYGTVYWRQDRISAISEEVTVEIFAPGGWSTGEYDATLEGSYHSAVTLLEAYEKQTGKPSQIGYQILIRSDKTAEIKLSHEVDSLDELKALDIEVRSDRVELVLEKN